MKTGPVPPRQLPRQDTAKVLLMAARFNRAATAHAKWATTAKTCVDFFEGRQWTESQIANMTRQGRKPFQFNVIAPLVRLILGYQSNNKSDIVFKPGNDALSTQEIAEALTRVEKAVAIMNKMPFVDTEVFMDGILTGRGYYRSVLDFDSNDLGELRTRALDPFFTYIDPDADTYDLNESATYIQVAKYVSIDEIEATYGKIVSEYLTPFTNGGTPIAPASSMFIDEISPERFFGGRDSGVNSWWDSFSETMGDFVDTHRKTIRILETEHKVTEERDVLIDLETGDTQTLPAGFPQEKVQKLLLYGDMTGNPLTVQRRLCRIVHWTTTCGDMILYDRESIYRSFSITPFFPYFRRGQTRSPIADMLDPQMEKNKRRTAEIEAVSKLSNGGWMAKKGVMNRAQLAQLRQFGSTPGFVFEYDGDAGSGKPEQIQPAAPPMNHERLEAKSDEDIRRISGINESALGEIDKVQSGRAIEARQRQAVISLQVYLDNFKHSKELLGQKRLEVYQQHYLEPRLYRILGEDGKEVQQEINQRQLDPGSGAVQAITNNITIGKYACVVDEQPLSATFANAQFEEMMSLLERLAPALGPSLPAFADLIIDASSLPRKTEWITRLASLGIGGQPQPMPMPPGAPGQPVAAPGQPQQVGGPPAQPQLMPPG